MTSLLIQVVLIATLFSDDAFTFALSLCSHLSLIPYFLSAAFLLKLVQTRETYERDAGDREQGLDRRRPGDGLHALPAVRGRYEVHAARASSSTPRARILYFMTRREQGKQLFTPAEWLLFAVAVVGAVVGVHGLVTGYITI